MSSCNYLSACNYTKACHFRLFQAFGLSPHIFVWIYFENNEPEKVSRHTVAVNSAAAEAQTPRQRHYDSAIVGARFPYDYGKYVLDVFFPPNNSQMKSGGNVKGLCKAHLVVVVGCCMGHRELICCGNILQVLLLRDFYLFIFVNRLFSWRVDSRTL